MVGFGKISTWISVPIAAAATLSAPAAHAVEVPVPVLTEESVNQITEQLSFTDGQAPSVGTTLLESVDPSLANALTQLAQAGAQVDATVREGIADLASSREHYADATVSPVTGVESRNQEEPVPNYQWSNDPVSRFMAQTPGPVLHRVGGSWFNSPDIPGESKEAEAKGKSLYGPGTPVFVGENNLCTVTATGTDDEGRKLAITAGHCGEVGDTVVSADSWRVGPSGTVVSRSEKYDYEVIELGPNAEVTNSYNGVTANNVGKQQAGSVACKQGVATGNTCGVVWMDDQALNPTQICAMRGDSGAPVLQGDTVVGMVDGGATPDQRLSCQTPLQGAMHMPTMTVDFNRIVDDLNERGGVGAGFQLTEAQ